MENTISIKDLYGEEFIFEKPDFECDLLKVTKSMMDGKLKYITIIAHVVGKYEENIAIAYAPSGFVFDGREGFDKYTLVSVNNKIDG